MQPPRNISIGSRFGRWTVVANVAENRRWPCKCDCGTERSVSEAQLVRAKSRSCGCNKFGNADAGPINVRRNATRSSWLAMMRRCYYPKNGNYWQYGAKGITVCQRWHDFEFFLTDMGERPEGKTLDRINGALGYEVGNCRWATPVEQAQNRRPRRRIAIDLSVAAKMRAAGCSYDTIAKAVGASWMTVRRRLCELSLENQPT